jgi:Tfp pilus assembly protein PilN
MTATMVPPPTAPSKPPGGEARFVSVRANLLPDEIISTRQTEVVRKQVLLGLILAVVLIVGWFGLSWWQTRSANGNLDAAQHRGVALQSEQDQFAPLVRAQGEIVQIQTQLQQLMVGDLSWKTMLTTLRAKAPEGVALTAVDGNITAAGGAGAAAPDASILNSTGKQTVGELKISGTARDKRSVAAYADQLATVRGLAAPLIESVDAAQQTVQFTVSVLITTDALGGRYAAPSSTSTTPATGGN